MVTVNRAQLQALKTLIAKVDIEEVEIEPVVDEALKLTLKDANGASTKLMVDKWGQGRLA